MTWTGATNGDWMTAGNWSGDTVPQAGDDLVFPATSSNFKVVNDFPANTALQFDHDPGPELFVDRQPGHCDDRARRDL